MQSTLNRSLVALVLGVGLFAGGCGSSGNNTSNNSSAASGTSAKKSAEAVQAMPKGLAELSPSDRALAEKQKICPVSGEALGGMGKPYKTTIKGKTVFLCCDACEEELKKNPDKYLAKLAAAEKK